MDTLGAVLVGSDGLGGDIATGALAESLIQYLSVVHDAGEGVARVIPRHPDEPASYAQHLDDDFD